MINSSKITAFRFHFDRLIIGLFQILLPSLQQDNKWRRALIKSGTMIQPAITMSTTTQTAPEALAEGRKSFTEIFFLKAAEVWFFNTFSSFFICSISWASFSSFISVYLGMWTMPQGHLHSRINVQTGATPLHSPEDKHSRCKLPFVCWNPALQAK